MVEIPDVGRGGTESIRLVDNQLRFVVQSFDGAVVDGHPEVVEDVVLMAANHPGELTQRREPRVGRPPEPLLEILFRPTCVRVVPEVPEQFLEQVKPD